MDKQQAAKLKQNINNNRKGNQASRYGQKGLTNKAAKINSHGFNKMMGQRGVNKSGAKDAWDSFAKSKKSPVMVRHAKKGEKFKVTHGKKSASGIYVSKKSLGKTPAARINKGALPPSNNATRQSNVRLGKNQNLVYGKIAAQPNFQKADPANLPRKGGGMQTLTDGGFKKGAVKRIKNSNKPSYKQKSTGFSKAASKTAAKSNMRTASKSTARSASKGQRR